MTAIRVDLCGATRDELSVFWDDEVDGIVNGFEFELCYACGRDLDAHVIVPGMFGKPFAQCLNHP